jgi:glycosyltransferase involved in cell wall biosynthesis
MVKVSVILPCLNAANSISNQIEALANQEYSDKWEIIVADNGSTDGTVAIVREYQKHIPHLRIVDASARRGVAYARNLGASVAQGEALVFCDADDEVGSGWLAAMAKALSQYDLVAGVKEFEKVNQPWVVNSCKYIDVDVTSKGVINHPYLPFAGGNNLGIKRSLHNAIGGFDEAMINLQDVDYCWRIQEAGTKLHQVPDAVIHFRLRNSIKGLCNRWWKFGYYNVLLHQKHHPKGLPQLITWQGFVKDAITLPLKFLVKVHDKESLTKWLMDFAWFAGHVHGCIKFQYLPGSRPLFGINQEVNVNKTVTSNIQIV